MFCCTMTDKWRYYVLTLYFTSSMHRCIFTSSVYRCTMTNEWKYYVLILHFTSTVHRCTMTDKRYNLHSHWNYIAIQWQTKNTTFILVGIVSPYNDRRMIQPSFSLTVTVEREHVDGSFELDFITWRQEGK